MIAAVGTVVATYQASVELTRLLCDIVELTIERGQALSMEPLESARPLLDGIRQNIRQHIRPSAAVTSGQRGLAHKAAALLHLFSLELPSRKLLAQ